MSPISPITYLRREGTRLRSIHRNNVATLRRQPWSEISGAFGDIGTFIPIFIALSQPTYGSRALISPAATLVLSGLANVLTGIFFGLPLPVQPMKAIAAVVIASPNSFSAASMASAGIFAGAVVAVLSATGLVQWFTRTMPIPIVKGIQVSAGLNLAMSGIKKLDVVRRGIELGNSSEIVLDISVAVVLLACTLRPRLRFVGVVMVLGVSLGILNCIGLALDGRTVPGLGIWHPYVIIPSGSAFRHGAFDAGLGQIPLTALNSIVAVVFLAEDIFPDNHTPSATAIGLSVAAMSLVGCWFGAMPVCHGSGGLAAQYRFGARSGASIVFLGALKMVTGLFAAEMVIAWIAEFPDAVLSPLLIMAGIELVKMGENVNTRGARDLWEESTEPGVSVDGDDGPGGDERFVEPDAQTRTRRYLLMKITVAATLATQNVGIGFLAGVGLWLVYKLLDWDAHRREGQIRLENDETDADAVHT